jgi:hypothetical protein
MSDETDGKRFKPIGDVDSALRDLEASESPTGTAIGVSPFEPYVHMLIALGAEIASANLKDYFKDHPNEIPEKGRAPLMNVFALNESFAFFVIRTRDRDWLLHALHMISAEQARRRSA